MLQPAAVPGGVVQLQPVGSPLGLGRRERLIQRRGRVGVAVSWTNTSWSASGSWRSTRSLLGVRPVDAGAPVADDDLAPASQRLGHQEQVAHPAALVLVIVAGRPARPDRAGRGDLVEPLPAGLVQADLGAARVLGRVETSSTSSIRQQQLGVLLGRDAQRLGQPRLELGCCKAGRTVSYDTDSTTRSPTS
jgi:hypothetical protein